MIILLKESIGWPIPYVFQWLRTVGKVSEEEMLKTFNCGIGMAIIVDKREVDMITDHLLFSGIENVYIIGEIIIKS